MGSEWLALIYNKKISHLVKLAFSQLSRREKRRGIRGKRDGKGGDMKKTLENRNLKS